MTKLVVLSVFSMFSLSAQAATYNCVLAGWESNEFPQTPTYQIDTSRDENKFLDLGKGASVGCIVFRSEPQRITCGVGKSENSSVFTTADIGSSVISVSVKNQEENFVLTCVGQP